MTARFLLRLTALAAAGALVPALTAGAAPQIAPQQAPAPTPGAAGIGDPYYATYGNGGYDVTSYAIKARYRTSSDRLTGRATIRARATQALSSFDLDLVLKATSVTVNGRKARFTQNRVRELVVTPAAPVAAGTRMTVVVAYEGKPSKAKKLRGTSPFTRADGGGLAVGEPEIAPWWFPSNDHPRDKATYDIAITVPKGVEAISNGRLRSKRTKKGLTTWTWREDKPMATYLAYFAAGQYKVTATTVAGRRYVYAVPRKQTAQVKRAAKDLRRTPQILAWEARQFGPYPFSTGGGVVTSGNLGFALENQSRPVYDQDFWSEKGPGTEFVVVHENAHQWFGDSVSVRNWRDIWLNEGFATFAEWLYSEQYYGRSGADLLKVYYDGFDADDEFWDVRIGDPGAGNEFDGAVYDRGAMTLQALRNRVGDATFRRILRTWVQERAYRNGEIADFTALAERLSGQDLDGFFRAWLYTGAKPAATAANGLSGVSGSASTSRVPSAATQTFVRGLDRLHTQMRRR